MTTCMVMRLGRLQGLNCLFFLTRLVSDERRVGKEAVLYKHQFSLSLSLSLSLSRLSHVHTWTQHTRHLACGILYMLYTSTLTVFDQKQELENTYIVFKGQQNSSTGVWLSGPWLTADSLDDVSSQQAAMTGKLSVNMIVGASWFRRPKKSLRTPARKLQMPRQPCMT